MNRYENLENLINWLSAHSKIFSRDNLNAWLDDLENQYASSGSATYELPSRETFSGHPECYRFKVVDKFFCDGRELTEDEVDNGEDWDDVKRIYVF